MILRLSEKERETLAKAVEAYIADLENEEDQDSERHQDDIDDAFFWREKLVRPESHVQLCPHCGLEHMSDGAAKGCAASR